MAKVRLVNASELQKELELAGWMASVSADSNSNYESIAKKCISSGHLTVTRGMRFLFELSELSRVVSHEFVRHEIGLGKCQRSQRYVKEDGFGYVMPRGIASIRILVNVPIIKADGTLNGSVETWLDFDDFQGIVEQMYTGYVRQGCKAEDARYALTNATFTKINVSFNYEGMKNFFNKRLCFRCQPEMRRMAELMLHEVTDAFPYFGGVFMCKCNEAGYCVEEKCCGKFPTKEEVLSVYRNYDKARPTAEAVRNCK